MPELTPRDLAPGEMLEDASAEMPPGSAVPVERIHPGYGKPLTGIGWPADGTWSPEVSNAPDAP